MSLGKWSLVLCLLAVGGLGLVTGCSNDDEERNITGPGDTGGQAPDVEAPDMVTINAGDFWLGSPEVEAGRDADENPRWAVLNRDVFVGVYEVTGGQWLAAGLDPARLRAGVDSLDIPVDSVTWVEAVELCNALSTLEGFQPAYQIAGGVAAWDRDADGYRLPTEHEWEYVTRGGNFTSVSGGWLITGGCGNDQQLAPVAWYCGSNYGQDLTGQSYDPSPRPGGLKGRNPLGLYDVHGNVWEWCWDWAGEYEDRERDEAYVDPLGPDTGDEKILRGGSCFATVTDCRAGNRSSRAPDTTIPGVGLRLFRNAAPGEVAPDPTMVRVAADTMFFGSIGETELGRGGDESLGYVRLTVDYQLSATEITQGLFAAAMGYNPSYFNDCPDCPVDGVDWWDALRFCNILSMAENLTPAYEFDGWSVTWNQEANGYRLPTEAEWEFACRGGSSSTLANFGSSLSNGELTVLGYEVDPLLDQVAWYGANCERPQPVGTKEANDFGLFDVHGNVWEWCWDGYGSYGLYNRVLSPVTDPVSAGGTGVSAVRGGGWNSTGEQCRSASRGVFVEPFRKWALGFRIARTVTSN